MLVKSKYLTKPVQNIEIEIPCIKVSDSREANQAFKK
jgi:hypothetical protein